MRREAMGRGAALPGQTLLSMIRAAPADAIDREQDRPRAARRSETLERMTGIEPAFSAWEADVLPLNYIRAWCPAIIAQGFPDRDCEWAQGSFSSPRVVADRLEGR